MRIEKLVYFIWCCHVLDSYPLTWILIIIFYQFSEVHKFTGIPKLPNFRINYNFQKLLFQIQKKKTHQIHQGINL